MKPRHVKPRLAQTRGNQSFRRAAWKSSSPVKYTWCFTAKQWTAIITSKRDWFYLWFAPGTPPISRQAWNARCFETISKASIYMAHIRLNLQSAYNEATASERSCIDRLVHALSFARDYITIRPNFQTYFIITRHYRALWGTIKVILNLMRNIRRF